MSQLPEAFVKTPLGTLRVWASGEGTLSAATMRRFEKQHHDYRDNADAQRCAEHVMVNRVAYTVVVHLRPAGDFPADGGVGERLHRQHAGWGINWYGVTLRRVDRYEGPSDAARRNAEDILLPALAGFANSPAGRRLLAQGATARHRERIAELGREIASRHAELQRLQTELADLEHADPSNQPPGPAGSPEGGAAR
ncbi:MAG TPA: hypothetical protein VFA45_01450 [Actinomycetes bacterium]|jgi:hypothetical protein|nr:hypothetical protein [Actinomycetes bacterium]